MKLQKTYRRGNRISHIAYRVSQNTKSGAGFTLIEMLVSLGIFVMLMSLGLFLSMDFYRGYTFNYEQNLTVALLQAARSQSMSNINQARHGVHFDSNQYVIFQGSVYDPSSSLNRAIPHSQAIEISGPDIIFKQLSGNSAGGSIEIRTGAKTVTISVNSQGRINW